MKYLNSGFPPAKEKTEKKSISSGAGILENASELTIKICLKIRKKSIPSGPRILENSTESTIKIC